MFRAWARKIIFMRMRVLPSFLMLFLLLLAGCMSREVADERLAKACVAGAQMVMPEGDTVELLSHQATDLDNGSRHVAVTVLVKAGWLQDEAIFECAFTETFSFLKTSHSAALNQYDFGHFIQSARTESDMMSELQQNADIDAAVQRALR
jgi:hypothetical protein